jgi:hypothetical protein
MKEGSAKSQSSPRVGTSSLFCRHGVHVSKIAVASLTGELIANAVRLFYFAYDPIFSRLRFNFLESRIMLSATIPLSIGMTFMIGKFIVTSRWKAT